jgi:hypothetical protein
MNAECRASNRVYSIRAAEVIADKRIRIRQEVNMAEAIRCHTRREPEASMNGCNKQSTIITPSNHGLPFGILTV